MIFYLNYKLIVNFQNDDNYRIYFNADIECSSWTVLQLVEMNTFHVFVNWMSRVEFVRKST